MSKKANLLSSAILILLVVIGGISLKPISIHGSSMEPGYVDGTNYLVNKLAYSFLTPKRGDVVTFHYKKNPQYLGIGRIIGLPGETIKIQGGKVFIDALLLQEKYIPEHTMTQVVPKSEIQDVVQGRGNIVDTNEPKIIDEGQEFVIPDNEYFIMGDNREHSIDSRSLGMVESKDITGKLSFRYTLPF